MNMLGGNIMLSRRRFLSLGLLVVVMVTDARCEELHVGVGHRVITPNPLLPVSLGGNLKLQVEMTDAALGGQTDKVGVTLWNSAGGLWFSSNWTGTTSVQQLLGGGNISVR